MSGMSDGRTETDRESQGITRLFSTFEKSHITIFL